MRRINIALIMILCSVCIHAQKVTKGSFSVLANEKTISVSIDYSDSKIDGVPFDIFLEGEENWNDSYRDIIIKYMKAANQNSDGIIYSTKQSGNYQLVFKATSVDRDGETTGYLQLLDKNDNEIGTAEGFNANGGSFGSQANLMGDASKKLGKKIANFINKQIKISKKNKVNQ